MSASLLDAAPVPVTALPTVAELHGAHPLRPARAAGIARRRAQVRAVLDGADDRLMVVTGPCSVHEPVAALDFADRLAGLADRLADDLLIVLRTYLEKPRTVVGWTGMLTDPHRTGTGDLAAGLAHGRRFLLAAAGTGLPLAYEFVDPLLAPYVADLVSWGAIGARTVASQPHRQLASALPLAVGMKNCTSGRLAPAIDAVRAAGAGHCFPGVGEHGGPVMLRSGGNPDAHVVLRGGTEPNFDRRSVQQTLSALTDVGLPARVVVDASHGNSGKDFRRQPAVLADLAGQVADGQQGLAGVMTESFLAEGSQEVGADSLAYGVSVTDGCLGWRGTVAALETLADAVRQRRRRAAAAPLIPAARPRP